MYASAAAWRLLGCAKPSGNGKRRTTPYRTTNERIIAPKLATISLTQIARETGVSTTTANTYRRGTVPHPRHWATLAQLAGVAWPDEASANPLGTATRSDSAPEVGKKP